MLSDWLDEDPSRAVSECAAMAPQEAVERVGKRLSADMPGDSHRDLARRHRARRRHRVDVMRKMREANYGVLNPKR